MATRDRGGWTRRTLLGMVLGDPDYHYPPLRGRVERFQVIPGYSGSSGACTHTQELLLTLRVHATRRFLRIPFVSSRISHLRSRRVGTSCGLLHLHLPEEEDIQ